MKIVPAAAPAATPRPAKPPAAPKDLFRQMMDGPTNPFDPASQRAFGFDELGMFGGDRGASARPAAPQARPEAEPRDAKAAPSVETPLALFASRDAARAPVHQPVDGRTPRALAQPPVAQIRSGAGPAAIDGDAPLPVKPAPRPEATKADRTGPAGVDRHVLAELDRRLAAGRRGGLHVGVVDDEQGLRVVVSAPDMGEDDVPSLRRLAREIVGRFGGALTSLVLNGADIPLSPRT